MAQHPFQKPPPPTATLWLTQRFDHFNASDTRTFSEQVLVYDAWFVKGSNAPIFLIAGGEGPVRGGYDHDGQAFAMAKTHKGLVFSPEHRWYGQSLPFGPVHSYEADNLKRLTVQQALADYAAALAYIRRLYNATGPAISVGGSYPGELASFLRQQGVVDFALASSAPLLYRPGSTVPNAAFFAVATKAFGLKNKRCPDLMRAAFKSMKKLFHQDPRKLQQELGLCTVPDDFDLLQLWVESAYADLVMGNYPTLAVYPEPWAMEYSCSQMVASVDAGNSVVVALKNALAIEYNQTSSPVPCHNITAEYLYCSDITGCGLGTDGLSWDYQFCTQLVCNADTNEHDTMFPTRPFSLTALNAYCQKRWGVTPQPKALLQMFPPSKGDHILYPNGQIDGWGPGGILESDPSRNVFAFNVTLGAHHYDLYGNDPADTTFVMTVRQQIHDVISKWIAEWHAKH